MRILCALLLWAAFQAGSAGAELEVAITIDDLPRGGDRGPRSLEAVLEMTTQLLAPFAEQEIPVIGFVNEGRQVEFGPDGLRRVLDVWLDAGADLGNHSYSHLNINQVPLAEYTADIERGEPITRAALAARSRALRYFRHPFLFTGPTPAIKEGMQDFLDRRGYRVAPVTIDNGDYLYAALYTSPKHAERVRREYVPYMESVVAFFERRAVAVVGREIPQILLLHANRLNADLMPELIAMFRRRGYTFVSLEQALEDAVYSEPETYAGPAGISWIHRWSMTRGMPNEDEPEPSAWARDAFQAL